MGYGEGGGIKLCFGGIKLCCPPNSMGSQQVPHEPALQLSMDPSPCGFAIKKKDLDEAEGWAGRHQEKEIF